LDEVLHGFPSILINLAVGILEIRRSDFADKFHGGIATVATRPKPESHMCRYGTLSYICLSHRTLWLHL
jgi:hypothetical protein